MNQKSNWKRILLRILSYVLVAVLSAVITFFAAGYARWNDMSKLEQLEEIIDIYYIEDYDLGEIEDAAAAAMVDALGNPWSYYISADDYEAYQDTHSNSFVGIGVEVLLTEDGTGLEIMGLEENGGAKEAGLLPGDIIQSVEDQPISQLGINGATQLIRGAESTTVSLTVLRGEENMTFEVQRKRIQVVVATGEMLEGNIGLITISNFNERCASETIELIQQLLEEGAESLIFDVRFNPGGYKDEMIKILDYLLPEGELFRSVDYLGNEETDRSDSKCLEIPMAVMINEDSYSAAEFFAAALQEYDWATVVGTPSTGKSHFQIAIPMTDGSAVNLSVGKYYTPNGVSLADVGGLQPDVVVEVDEQTYRDLYYGNIPAAEDLQIAEAVQVLKTGE